MNGTDNCMASRKQIFLDKFAVTEERQGGGASFKRKAFSPVETKNSHLASLLTAGTWHSYWRMNHTSYARNTFFERSRCMKFSVGSEEEEGVTGEYCELHGSSYEMMKVPF
jgi:hypothetical protein